LFRWEREKVPSCRVERFSDCGVAWLSDNRLRGLRASGRVKEAGPITRCEAVRSPEELSAMRWSVETVFDSEEHILHWIGRLPGPTELR
jgi:hypothetical protein